VDGARRVRVRVRGRVQGVSYRAATRDRARSLGLVGWVRNLQDGSVVLEAEGAAAAVDELVTWCRRGPPGARVEAAEVAEAEVRGDESGFVIQHDVEAP
jgi:acylphosphatase